MRTSMRLALAIAILLPAAAWAQVGGPVQPGDVAVALSESLPTDTTALVRGGVQIGEWTQLPFLQSFEFDNLGGVPHNGAGNLLALNWGGATGGIIHSLPTDGSDVEQTLFLFDGSQTDNVRINGLSVSPDNTRLALHADNASLFIMDYTAGNGDGTGAAITGFTEVPLAFTPGGSQSTAWFDNDSILLYRLDAGFNANETQLVRADIDGNGNVTLTVVTDNIPVTGSAGSQFTGVEYQSTKTPWVICSYSDFSGATENTLTFIDPSDWSIADQISLSTSLNTARGIALGGDNRLYMSSFTGTVETIDLDTNSDGVVNAADLPYADNSTVDWWAPGKSSSFNGLDIAAGGPPIILFDGDFDALNVGTNPDCGNNAGAGAWFFGTSYAQAGVCEAQADQFTIATTDSFDSGAPGNSLHLNIVNDADGDHHLPNRFNVVLQEGEPVTVSFDIWVVSGGGGGSMYVGADHGGGGFNEATDRGPQLSWLPDGTIIISPGNVVIVPAYPFDEWQSVRLEIDLVADTFDAFWGPRGGNLAQVGTSLPFRSGTQDRLDRFTFVNFGGLMADAESYLDNVTVAPVSCADPCDMNCDGTVNAFDIEPFLGILFDGDPPCDSCTGDANGDGNVDAFDIEPFLVCLFG